MQGTCASKFQGILIAIPRSEQCEHRANCRHFSDTLLSRSWLLCIYIYLCGCKDVLIYYAHIDLFATCSNMVCVSRPAWILLTKMTSETCQHASTPVNTFLFIMSLSISKHHTNRSGFMKAFLIDKYGICKKPLHAVPMHSRRWQPNTTQFMGYWYTLRSK